MPAGDKTGPFGFGPGTGCRRGGCMPYGRGFGGRMGYGFFRRDEAALPPSSHDQVWERMAALEEKVDMLLEKLKDD